ncbi:hypothetical protein Clacol_001463 [Clathrus columnatus]|uniref:DASH complex subunit SPC19 n=1 Tax=Clathrus columnatus TaxID=1419009 RepID=A0AAV5A1A6_9AGAM|nr:hypothetical protein Clacol_001463 [Clathrus columnatus]
MYRPSTAFNAKPRESVFISGPVRHEDDSLSNQFIEACVSAAQESCDKLYDAQCSLRRGVSDLPRKAKILRNERLFLLINESHAEMCRTQLAEEIGPQIIELAEKSEKGVQQLERKANLLRTKLEAAKLNRNSVPSKDMKKLEAMIKAREALEKEVQALGKEIETLEMHLE